MVVERGFKRQFSHLQFEVNQEGIAILTFTRPDRFNVVDRETQNNLVQCWEEINENPAIRVTIVTGTGQAWCSGTDVEDRGRGWGTSPERHRTDFPYESAAGWHNPWNHMPVRKPVIGAINGWVVFNAVDLFMLMDIRVMAEDAFLQTYAQMINLMPLPMFSHILPWAIYAEMELTGARLSARTLERWGAVNRVVPQDKVMETALAYAHRVLEMEGIGPDALKKAKLNILANLEHAGEQAGQFAVVFDDQRLMNWKKYGPKDPTPTSMERSIRTYEVKKRWFDNGGYEQFKDPRHFEQFPLI